MQTVEVVFCGGGILWILQLQARKRVLARCGGSLWLLVRDGKYPVRVFVNACTLHDITIVGYKQIKQTPAEVWLPVECAWR